MIPDRPPSTGPFLTTAALCEKVLEEKDGSLSLIRIIDRVMVPVMLDAAPPAFACKGVVTLRSGTAQGRATVTVRAEKPSGQQLEPISVGVLFEGQERGVNVLFDLGIVADEE